MEKEKIREKEELVRILRAKMGDAIPGVVAVQGELLARISLDLEEKLTGLITEISKATKASNKLSTRVLWLDLILGTFTIVGAIAGLYALFGL
jgi:hypothetical protein